MAGNGVHDSRKNQGKIGAPSNFFDDFKSLCFTLSVGGAKLKLWQQRHLEYNNEILSISKRKFSR